MVNSVEVIHYFKRDFMKVESVVLPETTDAVRELILKDRRIVTTMGISGINIFSILNKYLTVKKFSHWNP